MRTTSLDDDSHGHIERCSPVAWTTLGPRSLAPGKASSLTLERRKSRRGFSGLGIGAARLNKRVVHLSESSCRRHQRGSLPQPGADSPGARRYIET